MLDLFFFFIYFLVGHDKVLRYLWWQATDCCRFVSCRLGEGGIIELAHLRNRRHALPVAGFPVEVQRPPWLEMVAIVMQRWNAVFFFFSFFFFFGGWK